MRYHIRPGMWEKSLLMFSPVHRSIIVYSGEQSYCSQRHGSNSVVGEDPPTLLSIFREGKLGDNIVGHGLLAATIRKVP